MRRALLFGSPLALALAFVLVCQAQKKEKPPAFTDAKEAGADFVIQGEYEGEDKKHATRYGAQVVALGNRVSAVMANDDAVRDGIAEAAGRAGEAFWPMPLPEELRKGLDSRVADLANVAAERAGGMLTAGLFLREFVPDGVRWAHLDIAGVAWKEGKEKGATGRPVALLTTWLLAQENAAA